MTVFYTSKKSICGLRHFVLIDEFILNRTSFKFLVSVIDSNVFIQVSDNEFQNSGNWEYGFKQLSQKEAISSEYQDFRNKRKAFDDTPIILSKRSRFNIS